MSMKYEMTPTKIRWVGAGLLLFFPVLLPIMLIYRTWRYFAGSFYAAATGRYRIP